MRPVNLIPKEERRDGSNGTGVLPWLVIGALVLALICVTAVTLAGKGVADKEAEVESLQAREAEVSARAQSLAAYVNFEQVRTARVDTVTALAQSRFDWERVIRELSLVLPSKVWLTSLIGTVSPAVSVSDGESVNLRAEVPGPALELVGCASSQREVASLIAALGDIDGVTRVTAGRSEKPVDETTQNASGGGSVGEDCRTRNFITRFEIVAAFDEVPVPDTAVPTPAQPGAAGGSGDPSAGGSEDSGSGDAGSGDSGPSEDSGSGDAGSGDSTDSGNAADQVPASAGADAASGTGGGG